MIRATTVESSAGTWLRRRAEPEVVRMPAVSSWSFTAKGMPCSGPRHWLFAASLSARFASTSALSPHTVMKARSSDLSRSMRSRYAVTSSTGERRFSRMSAACRDALAKASSSVLPMLTPRPRDSWARAPRGPAQAHPERPGHRGMHSADGRSPGRPRHPKIWTARRRAAARLRVPGHACASYSTKRPLAAADFRDQPAGRDDFNARGWCWARGAGFANHLQATVYWFSTRHKQIEPASAGSIVSQKARGCYGVG